MTDKTNQVPTLSALSELFPRELSLWTDEDEGGSTDLSPLPSAKFIDDNNINVNWIRVVNLTSHELAARGQKYIQIKLIPETEIRLLDRTENLFSWTFLDDF